MKLVQLRNHRENKQTVQKRQQQYSRIAVQPAGTRRYSRATSVSRIHSCFPILQYGTLPKLTGMPNHRNVGIPSKRAASIRVTAAIDHNCSLSL